MLTLSWRYIPVFWLFLLPMEMCDFAVMRMLSRNWLSFGQGSKWLRLGAKLQGGTYKSNTDVKFRQAITDGYD